MKKATLQAKMLTLTLIISLIFGSLSLSVNPAYAAEQAEQNKPMPGQSVPDIKGHWAETQLQRWVEAGLLQGYADGGVAPDQRIARGELAALINRSFGFTEKAEIAFGDLSAADWQYNDISIAVKEGYLSGYEDSTVRVNKEISRQEAAVMLERILQPYVLEPAPGSATGTVPGTAPAFTDSASIAAWSQAAVQQLAARKILSGYTDGSFKPLGSLTRAEAVTLLDRVLAWLEAEKNGQGSTGTSFDQAGEYGSAEKAQIISGSVQITAKGVTLRNMTINGDLLLTEGIGEGDVLLDHVTVKGVTTIRGGGAQSIHIRDSVLGEVIVDKKTGTVRIVLEGSSRTGVVTVRSSVILEEEQSSLQGGYTSVKLAAEMPAGSKVSFKGHFATIDVEASQIIVEQLQGIIDQLTVQEQAKGTELKVDKDAKIILLVLKAIVKVLGQGTIEKADVSGQAKGTTFEKRPLQLSGAGAQNLGASTGSGGGNSGNENNGENGGNNNGNNPLLPVKPVENGQGHAVILVAPNAGEQVQDAAETLAEYIYKSTGVELPVQTTGSEMPEASAIRIYVGMSAPQDQQEINTLLTGLTNDSFVIVPKENRISILGPAAWGTEYGVYDFLERYVGVRWLLPGPDGEDVPLHQTLEIAPAVVREKPAFMSRRLVGLFDEHSRPNPTNSDVYDKWGKRNRNLQTIESHHNLYNLFPPSVYLETHPDFYPQGNQHLDKGYGWQPCFSNPATIDEAIKNIKAYFAQHPEATSYSLGINDLLSDYEGFCESYSGEKNSIGRANMSDVYYDWVNQVAEGVLLEYPDKYFGLLAYAEVYDPPSDFSLNPHVIPYITDERFTWGDERVEAIGKSFTERWNQAATSIGWYEYLYGGTYTLPKVYNERMADNYRYGLEKGVVGTFSELYPNWGEGPKPWLSLKLQWNPEQDEAVLLQEWYERAVGAEAAADLAAYYEHWEEFWSTRIFETSWYETWYQSNPRANYMPFYDASYLKAVKAEEIVESRRLLEAVVEKASTAQQKKRAEMLLHNFEYYEASALSYPIISDVNEFPDNTTEAIELLDDLMARQVRDPIAMYAKRLSLVDEYETDPVLALPSRPQDVGMVWQSISYTPLLLVWLNGQPEEGAVWQHLQQVAEVEEGSEVGEYAAYLLDQAQHVSKTLLNLNPSFEEYDAYDGPSSIHSANWNYGYYNDNRTEEEVAYRTNAYARTGTFSIAAKGISKGIMMEGVDLSAPPQTLEVKGYYYTAPGTGSSGKVKISLNFYGDSGVIHTATSAWKTVSATEGQWAPVQLFHTIPEYLQPSVRWILLIVEQEGFQPGEIVYIDDVGMFEVNINGSGILLSNPVGNEESIAVTLSEPPAAAPTVEDFRVFKSINGGPQEPVVLSTVSWDEASQIAIVHFDPLLAAVGGDKVVYRVQYLNGAPVQTDEFRLFPGSAINLNPSFEEYDAYDGPSSIHSVNWNYGYYNDDRTEEEVAYRTDAYARTGTYSIAAKGISQGIMMEEVIPEEPLDSVGVTAYYYTALGTGSNGKVKISLNFYGASGVIHRAAGDWKQVSASEGKWAPVQLFHVIPENLRSSVTSILLIVEQEGFQPGEIVYTDDVGVFEVNMNGESSILLSNPVGNEESIAVTLSEPPTAAPTVEDFRVFKSINGGPQEPVVLSTVSWDEASQIAIVHFDPLLASAGADKVVYRVQYLNGAPVQTEEFRLFPGSAINLNPSFEEYDAYDGPSSIHSVNWNYGYYNDDRTEEEVAYRTDAYARTGTYSIAAKGISQGIMMEEVIPEAPLDNIGVTAYFYTAPGTGSNGKVKISLNFYGASGVIHRATGDWKQVSASEGKWAPVQLFHVIPENLRSSVTSILLVIEQEGFQTGEIVYTDDANVYGGRAELSAKAVRTQASKAEILQTLDFSTGPWVDAEPFNDFLVMDKMTAGQEETKVYLLWDDENFYVGYENKDKNLQQMTLSEGITADGWWNSGGDDSVETYITLNPKGMLKGYFSNPNNIKFIYKGIPGSTLTVDTSTEWEVNAQIGSDRWNTVQVIPFSQIDVDPNVSKTLMGYFLRNYHGQTAFLGWKGGAPWRAQSFNPIQLIEKE
ncbi:DUF4838 domain-containing protein [Paenibacillus eucommiae]|uniref:Tfp pilus assembly protein PilX n=1 Tax=Paenibacillus eucommiae TaxID=1355755 RepID=A0ABS4IT26_9BACL|nr:DUF4838 domain-containing protein [Paenibacillus eucommiae]MBP1990712.1 Tfp pilus assembly protein PilX [Paenibacillus eucommiae]